MGKHKTLCHSELGSESQEEQRPWNKFRVTMEKNMQKEYYVYILTNKTNSTFYIGITNDIKRRVIEHKTKAIEGFTSKYKLNKLVYVESTPFVEDALNREKQLKRWHRDWKINLIKGLNPTYRDLSDDF